MTEMPIDHQIRMNPISPMEFQGGMDEMDKILDAVKPDTVIAAGEVYNAAASRLQASAAELHRQASNLKSVWTGDDADAAVGQMGRLRETAENMAKVARETGTALATYGPQLDWYKNEGRPGRGNFAGLSTGDAKVFAAGTVVAGPGGGMLALGGMKLGEAIGLLDSEEDKLAREHMNKLSTRTVETNDNLPRNLTTDIPFGGVDEGVKKPTPPGDFGGGGGGGGGGGQNIPKNPYGDQKVPTNPYDQNGPGTGPNVPTNPYDQNGPGTGPNVPKNPYGSGPGGSDLAGLPGGSGTPGGVGSDPFGRGGIGGGAGAGAGGFGGGAGGMAGGPMGAGGLAGGPPGTGRAGTGAGSGAGAGRGMGAGARGGAGGMMGGGAPMSRGGGGKGEEEHERSTWLVEDEDVWGSNDGDAAPPVIG